MTPARPETFPLLEVRNLKVHFPVRRDPFARVRELVKAVDGVSLAIERGETVGLVGESGSGKTTLARTVALLNEPTEGSIVFEGQDLNKLGKADRKVRRNLQMIFQDPYGSLDPRFTIDEIIAEGLEIHKLARDDLERKSMVVDLLRVVGLDPDSGQRYPHELSGGQRQRIGIARALAVGPSLIVCDEPVSALDVSVQAQIINLLRELQERRGVAYLFIAHDIAVVGHISRRIAVMYLGRIVELGGSRQVIDTPLHPYTQALISAVPVVDPASKRARIILAGEPPSPIHPPSGCPFHPRCPIAEKPRCEAEVPQLREIAPGHWTACHLAQAGGFAGSST
jgi:oligopeptide/dipeptide ABC transporter ATP-binding protein